MIPQIGTAKVLICRLFATFRALIRRRGIRGLTACWSRWCRRRIIGGLIACWRCGCRRRTTGASRLGKCRHAQRCRRGHHNRKTHVYLLRVIITPCTTPCSLFNRQEPRYPHFRKLCFRGGGNASFCQLISMSTREPSTNTRSVQCPRTVASDPRSPTPAAPAVPIRSPTPAAPAVPITTAWAAQAASTRAIDRRSSMELQEGVRDPGQRG